MVIVIKTYKLPGTKLVSPGDVPHSTVDYSEQYRVEYLEVAKRVDLKNSHHKRKTFCNYAW